MSQCNLFGIQSYQESRRIVKGQKTCAAQIDFFGITKQPKAAKGSQRQPHSRPAVPRKKDRDGRTPNQARRKKTPESRSLFWTIVAAILTAHLIIVAVEGVLSLIALNHTAAELEKLEKSAPLFRIN